MKAQKTSSSANPVWPRPTSVITVPPPPKMKAMKAMKTPLHDDIGITAEYTREQIMKVFHQNDHLPSKLKVMAPFAKELGIDLSGAEVSSTTNIQIVMPQEIATKYKLTESKIIDHK